MRGRIDDRGYLHIDRKGTPDQPQRCPFTRLEDPWCGDWCPHFNDGQPAKIGLCGGTVLDVEFMIDDRGGPKSNTQT